MNTFYIGAAETDSIPAEEVESPDYTRMKCGIESVDNFFSGGLVPGQVVLLSGVSGCGKTTILLQIMEAYSLSGYDSAYGSSEESQEQLKDKCDRIGINKVKISHSLTIGSVLELIEDNAVVVVDSLQSVVDTEHKTHQAQSALNKIVAYAKQFHTAVIVIGHATKTGHSAGTSALGHLVDTRISAQHGSEVFCRISPRVFTIEKSRFGKIGSMCWDMGDDGIFDLNNPYFNDLYDFSRAYFKRV